MPIPSQRDHAEARVALQGWLASRLDPATNVELSDVTGPDYTGFSSETLIFDATWETGHERDLHAGGFVVRVEPTGHKLFPDADFRLQWEVMSALAREGSVKVPPMFAFEQDTSILGAPFIAMGRVEGEAPADNPPYPMGGWLFEALPEDQERLWWSGLEAMAAVHRVDWRTLDLDPAELGPAFQVGLDDQLAYYQRWRDDAGGDRPQPVLDAGLAWLREHRPPEGDLQLCWGDSRLGNILFRDFEAVAVLDWEMACLGDPQQDLAWFLYFDRHHSTNLGVPKLAGVPDDAATVARWEELTGRTADQLEYYTVLAGLKFGVIMLRLGQMMVGMDILPMESDFERNNTATQLLANLLDLPYPC